MIDTIKHFLGLCGEGHPSLLTFLISGIGFSGILTYIKFNINNLTNNNKENE